MFSEFPGGKSNPCLETDYWIPTKLNLYPGKDILTKKGPKAWHQHLGADFLVSQEQNGLHRPMSIFITLATWPTDFTRTP
jgi:hypothetical protein